MLLKEWTILRITFGFILGQPKFWGDGYFFKQLPKAAIFGLGRLQVHYRWK